MLSRMWTHLGLTERKPAEVYQFDPHGRARDEHGIEPSRLELVIPGQSVSSMDLTEAGGGTTLAAAATGGDGRSGARDADILPFAPAAARAADRRAQPAELLWAAMAVVTLTGAALVARVYRDRRIRTQ